MGEEGRKKISAARKSGNERVKRKRKRRIRDVPIGVSVG
jgi:hypothetical protein